MQEEYLDQSIQLASIIQNEFTTKLKRKDRGVKQAGFVVLHQTYMPSILIETGFITNSKEGLYLNSNLGGQKFSESIYNGIKKYINQLTLNTVQGNAITEVSKTTKAAINEQEITNYKDVVFKALDKFDPIEINYLTLDRKRYLDIKNKDEINNDNRL